jgi:hypothetical protein
MSWFMLSRRLELVANIKLAVLETHQDDPGGTG